MRARRGRSGSTPGGELPKADVTSHNDTSREPTHRVALVAVLASGVLLRLWSATKFHAPVHPDAIFQGIEPAHMWVYGAGFKAGEFWSPKVETFESFLW
jgi:hypothetical protein